MSQPAPASTYGAQPVGDPLRPADDHVRARLTRSPLRLRVGSVSPSRTSPPHDGVNSAGARPSRSTSRSTSSSSRANISGAAAPAVPAVRALGRDQPDVTGPPADPDRVARGRARRGASRRSAMTRSGLGAERRARTSPSRPGSRSSPAPSPTSSRRSGDAQHGVERGGERRRAAAASRAHDERADRDPPGLGRDRAEQRDALERGPELAGSAVRNRWSNTNTPWSPDGLGGARDRERGLRILDERRERERRASLRADHAGSQRSSASTRPRSTPARSPSAAGTISGVGRYSAPSMWPRKCRADRVEEELAVVDQPAGDRDQRRDRRCSPARRARSRR